MNTRAVFDSPITTAQYSRDSCWARLWRRRPVALDVTAGVLTTDLTDHYAVLAGVERRAPRVGTHTDTEDWYTPRPTGSTPATGYSVVGPCSCTARCS
ncbi:hypothetical protein J6590_088289 [Homalodisca vitripennis]|nr:hypothetical protein J6590_088289 [Homalodisca vitripennis]